MFGRRNARLANQRAALAKLEPSIGEIRSLVSKAESRRSEMGSQPTLDALLASTGSMIALYDDMQRFFASATSEHPNFDAPLAAIQNGIADQRPLLIYFTILGDGFLLARQGGKPAGTVREAWNALLDHADGQIEAMRKEILELTRLKEKHAEIWPPKLDLRAMHVGTEDAANASTIYRERVSIEGNLPPVSAESIGKMIGMLANSFAIIARERQTLSDTIVARSMRERSPPAV